MTSKFDMRRGQPGILARRTLIGGIAAILPGCAELTRRDAVPADKTAQASVMGLSNERFYPTLGTEPLEREFVMAMGRNLRARGATRGGPTPPVQLLAVSGGREDGAFAAGVLCGWSDHGTRPVFDLVTGVSTGALIAPFAYLGGKYDPKLCSIYATLTKRDVMESRGLVAAMFEDAVADNAPLFRTISNYITAEMVSDIATGYDEGRLLLVTTTDLDAQLPVIWNIGAVAQSRHPRAVDTIRRVLLASAAIPGAFPPTMFDVSLDGKPYQEMHVDGGAFAQAFLYPAAVTQRRRERLRRHERVLPAVAYIIRNGRLTPEWTAVERKTLGVLERAVSTMTATSAYNDIVRMYNNTQRDGIDYNLAFIGKDFTDKLQEPFDQKFMHALFEYGYRRARHGYDWAKRPPL